MKYLIGRKCKLTIEYGNKLLFFTAKVSNVTDTHISFLDKFDDYFTFNVSDIKQVKVIKDEN